MRTNNNESKRIPLGVNATDDTLSQLRKLLPHVFSEGKVDFVKLQTTLGEAIDIGSERYGLNWAGKSEAFHNVQSPSIATLRPLPSESIEWQSSEDIIIEGDNLETLKLLQKAYHGVVKMIYIDPPYNTGTDFIYSDNYRTGVEDYLRYTGQLTDKGLATSTKRDLSGRYHSNWLNMMYPRLFLARNLLREDGVIFVSIDEHEVYNLRLLMNELFGEENFVVTILWKKRSTPPNDQIIGANHDYILCFAKNANHIALNLRTRTDEQIARYRNPDNHPKGPWTPGDLMANVKGGRFVASLNYAIINPNTGEAHYPSNNGNWRFNREKVEELLRNNEIYFGENGKGRPKLKRFLKDVKVGTSYPSIWDFVPLNTDGSREMAEIFGDMLTFESPKPSGLIAELLLLGSDNDSIVLDFFAGSGSTAHAVMDLNAKDGGNRKFILVQLPERTENPKYPTISDITRERVRRVISKLNETQAKSNSSVRTTRGFRAFKLDSSNFKLWQPDAAMASREQFAEQLRLYADNVKPDRSDDDLLFEFLLKFGYPLSSRIERVMKDHEVFSVGEGAVFVCLDRRLNQSILRRLFKLAGRSKSSPSPLILCLDIAFEGNDALKTNAALEAESAGIMLKTI